MTQQFRPYSANPSKKLGSTCPIIIKHDFPNDDQNYLDEGLITMNSYKKRFRYDESFNKGTPQRPTSALMMTAHPRSARIRASSSKNWHPASKAEFLSSVMKSIKNREKNEIKPIRKLKTMYFHSILYKVKQQKEDLDEKIRVMDNLKTDFKETDICILANTGAIDYILSLNAKANPTSCSNQLLKNEKKELEEIKESRKIMSQAHRPLSSHPNFYNPKKIEKKPEFLSEEDFYDESNEEFRILGNASKLYNRPGSGIEKSSSTNEISAKINGFINNCNRIKDLYESEQQNQFSKDPELIEIPEVEDNYKSVFNDKSIQNSREGVLNKTNPYKTILNMRVKPQKLYKTSLTKFHESGLSSSSMRVRAVEILNSTPNNHKFYNQIHSLKNPQSKFFNDKKAEIFVKYHERTEVKELSVSGFSNKMVKIKNLNDESELEQIKTVITNAALPDKKIQRPLTAFHKPIYKENKNYQMKVSPRNLIVDGSVFNMFSNVNIQKSINPIPQTAIGHTRHLLINNYDLQE